MPSKKILDSLKLLQTVNGFAVKLLLKQCFKIMLHSTRVIYIYKYRKYRTLAKRIVYFYQINIYEMLNHTQFRFIYARCIEIIFEVWY